MSSAFQGCTNLTIETAAGNPDLSNVTDMSEMFRGATAFNQVLNGWDVSNVTDMSYMFYEATAFNQVLSRWDVSKVTDMSFMFVFAAAFNQDIRGWDVGKVTNMFAMFGGAAAFNQDISGWDVSKVTNMRSMFAVATAFNQNLIRWDVSKVTDMGFMFFGAEDFNQDLSRWDVGKVTSMFAMFEGASTFNQDLSRWDVGKVTIMWSMFEGASTFNQDLSRWDVSKVTDMDNMFEGAVAFNQDISGWNVSNVSFMNDMFFGVTLSIENYDALLRGWSSLTLQSYVTFSGGDSIYCDESARNILVNTYNWSITDGEKDLDENCASYQAPFTFASTRLTKSFGDAAFTFTPTGGTGTGGITYQSTDPTVATIDTNTGEVTIVGIGTITITATKAGDTTYNPATARYILTIDIDIDNTFVTTWEVTTGSSGITIPTNSAFTYRYAVDWGDGSADTRIHTGDATHAYTTAGIYTVSISGTFPSIYFNASSSTTNSRKIQTIKQWGDNPWKSMNSAFRGCTNLTIEAAAGNPDLSNVTDVSNMFSGATAFNQNLSEWDVSNVTNMSSMFSGVTLSIANYDALLSGWSALTLQRNVTFSGGDSIYCDESARNILVDTYNWSITDSGKDLDENCASYQASFTFASTSLTKRFGGAAFTFTPTGGSGTGGITYLSIDPTVATIDINTGEVTIVDIGTTTITATKAGDTTYNPAIASYILTIDNAFVTTWEVTTGSSGITIPTNPTFDYSYTVDWGDNSVDTRVYTGDATHTYTTASIYTVSIFGTFPSIYFNSFGSINSRKIKTIKQWGDNPWKSMNNAFAGCTNLTIEAAAGNPNLSKVTDMSGMFASADAFNQNISGWDVSKVTSMSFMFYNATAFNQDLSRWNVSKVRGMGWMFSGVSAFNQDLSKWDVSNVGLMPNMFEDAAAFNQDISKWNVSNVSDMSVMFEGAVAFNQDISEWDVSNVLSMNNMFDGATAFNQDISGWKVSNVAYMENMFSGATAFNQNLIRWDVKEVTNMEFMFYNAVAFDQNISGWDVSNVTNMSSMFSGATLSIENYDALLRGWSTLPLQMDVSFDGGDNKYCDKNARDILLDTYNWSITDSGKDLDENCARYQAPFTFASTRLTKSFGDAAFTFTPTGGSGTGGITYQSTDPTVATIASDTGVVTIAGVGTTTITAAKTGDTTYNPATASYILTVHGFTLMLTPSTLTLNEGATTPYTAMLDTRPTGTVTVTIISDNTYVNPTPAALTFTTTNWNNAQSVTITAATDTNHEDNIATLTHTASNGGYAGVTAYLSITVTNTNTPLMFADDADIDPTYPANTPITPLTLPEASGGIGTLIYALTPKTSIPDGLTFDASTRTLSGTTPTTSSSAATLTYTVTDSATPTPKTLVLTFTVTVVQVMVDNDEKVTHLSGAIAVNDVGGDNNDMRLMLPAGHTVTAVMVGFGTYTPTPSDPLPNGATFSGVAVDIGLVGALGNIAATVCLSTAGVSEGRPALYHWTGSPAAWEEIGIDTSIQPGFVCGMTATFSPFAVGYKSAITTRLNEQILTRAAQAMTASTLAAVAARVESVADGVHGSGKPLAYQIDGQSSLRGLLEKNGKAMLEEQMDYQRLLDGASFVLPLSATDNASAGNAGKTAVWGSSDFRNLSDDEDDLDWEGQTHSTHLGMDRRFSERTLAGLALSWNNASFDFHDTANGADIEGEYQYSIVNIHPYFGWSNAGFKLWGTAGYGQGEIEINIDQEEGAESGDDGSEEEGEELSTDTTQLSLAGGFNHRLLGSPVRSLNIKGDVALTRVAVEADQAGNFAEQDFESSRVRLLLSGEQQGELVSGGTLTPSLEIGVRYDGGDGTTGTGTEVGAGLRYASSGGRVAVASNVRTLLAGEYDELGADFNVQLSSQSGRGLSFSLHPVWGRTQSVADKLWNDGSNEITGGDTELRGSVDTEVGYGMAATILGSPGLLMPYTGITSQDGGSSRLRLGGRFTDGNGLSMNLEGAQKNTTDGASHQVLLRGEVAF